MLLAMAERRLGLADNLARVFPDRRRCDAGRARPCRYAPRSHVRDLLRLRGRRRPGYISRSDPALKLACERLPDTGRDLCSQPTLLLTRLEIAPRLRDVIRLTYILVDAWMDSYPREPGICHARHR